MKQYLDLLRHVRDHGVRKKSRPVLRSTGTSPDTLSMFGYQMRFDLADGFPIVTTRKIHLDAVVYELLWFLRGDTNVRYLNEHGVHIWDPWADPVNGDCGPIYGRQWRRWHAPTTPEERRAYYDDLTRDFDFKNIDTQAIYDAKCRAEEYRVKYIDQIKNVITEIRSNPDSRRLVVSAWNPADLPAMAIAPCHALFQFCVSDGRLSCQLYQRSGDILIGIPHNIASYALLVHMVAQVTDLQPGEFVHTLGDAHIYENHLEQADIQLSRDPHPLPTLVLDPSIRDIDTFDRKHIALDGYKHHPALRAEVAV